jgi:phospholipid-binding lipoprotein MlaA
MTAVPGRKALPGRIACRRRGLLPLPLSLSLSLSLSLALALAGCATLPAGVEATPGDPLEPLNRNILALNMAVDDAAIGPVANVYRAVVPGYGRTRIRTFLGNLREPRVMANTLLQFRLRDAGQTVARFVVNSTFGVAGLFDVATDWGLPQRNGDLGQTLHAWGLGDGPYLVLPVAGPSNARDAVGWIGDLALDPFNWILPVEVSAGRAGLSGIDQREQNGEGLDELRRGSFDFYARLRSVWQQQRDAELGRAAGAEPVPEVLDDPGAAPAP